MYYLKPCLFGWQYHKGFSFFQPQGTNSIALVNTILFYSAGERKEEGRPRTLAGRQLRKKRERVMDLISSRRQNHWQVSPACNYINWGPAAGTPRNILAQTFYLTLLTVKLCSCYKKQAARHVCCLSPREIHGQEEDTKHPTSGCSGGNLPPQPRHRPSAFGGKRTAIV